MGGTRRFVSSVYEVMGLDRDTGELLVNRAFSRENGTYSFSRASYALRRLADATGTTEPELMADMKRRSQFLSSLQAGNMREFMAKVSSFL
ncbi:hypothetical protein [Thermogymnomonas acidicola]|uniref:hypothetical protein n=1 Tax=Thermogymnomonas acidicola TaxID=399579 RepID=UPI001493E29A|nr:hypothetical protein [Thermogymnomonas acidicola]